MLEAISKYVLNDGKVPPRVSCYKKEIIGQRDRGAGGRPEPQDPEQRMGTDRDGELL